MTIRCRRTIITWAVACLAATACTHAVSSQGVHVIHVDASAQGTATGESWQDAFACLQRGLAAAEERRSFASSVEVWVAAGCYSPQAADDDAATFNLIDGVAMYGGFGGYESTPSERDPSAYQTILSGRSACDTPVHHVLTARGVGPSAVLDGFIIEGGRAEGPGPFEDVGAALLVHDASPTIAACLFRDNHADSGGAVYVLGGRPRFVRCRFINNVAQYDGGGVSLRDADAEFIHCTFSSNTAYGSGGAMDVDGGNPHVLNCLLDGNAAVDVGGAIRTSNASTILMDCRMVNNSATWGGSGIANTEGDLALQRCRFDDNRAAAGGAISHWRGRLTVIDCRFDRNLGGPPISGDEVEYQHPAQPRDGSTVLSSFQRTA